MPRISALAIVTYTMFVSVAIGSDAPDNFRQEVRGDSLIGSIIEALSTKHGCPWLNDPHGNGGMRVMKEVEPFFYSSPRDNYKPTPSKLEIDLVCSHEVSATVHTMFDETEGHQPLVRFLDRIDFSYDNFLPKLGRHESGGESPSKFILVDPLVTRLYSVLTAQQENCDKMADGKIEIDCRFRLGQLVSFAYCGRNVIARRTKG